MNKLWEAKTVLDKPVIVFSAVSELGINQDSSIHLKLRK